MKTRVFCSIFLVACLRIGGEALATSSINNVNPGPEFLLESDAADGNPATNLHLWSATFEALFHNETRGYVGDFRVVYELRDDTNTALELSNALLGETTLGASAVVAMNNPHDPASPDFLPRKFQAAADPAGTLDPARRYRMVPLRIEEKVAGTWTALPDSVDPFLLQTDQHVIHFTNTARQNDLVWNLRGVVTSLAWTRGHLVETDPARDSFTAQVEATVMRYDEFGAFPLGGSVSSTIILDFDLLEEGTGTPVALENDGIVTVPWDAPPHVGLVRPLPSRLDLSETVSLRPAVGVQLASASKTYVLRCTLRHVEDGLGTAYTNVQRDLDARHLLHFNGRVLFGPLAGRFGSIFNNPVPGTVVLDRISTAIEVNWGAGQIDGLAEAYWGENLPMLVQLRDDGVSVYDDPGGVNLAGYHDSDLLRLPGGARFAYDSITLESGGATTMDARIVFPQGLTLVHDATAHAWIGAQTHVMPGLATLGANLLPSLPLSVALGPDAEVSDESHPLRFTTTGFTVAADGSLEFATTGVEYIHKESYDLLGSYTLDSPEMRERMSNDLYWREVAGTAGTVRWTAAADGSARMEGTLDLDPVDFQAHHPRGTTIVSSAPATVEISNGRPTAASTLPVAALSVAYHQTCPGDTCTSAVPPVEIAHSPDAGQLRFTPGGGLHARGAVPAGTRLEWGVRGYDGPDALYAHRTDTFSEAEFFMPGYQLYAADNPVGENPAYQTLAAYLATPVLHNSGYDPANDSIVVNQTQSYRDGIGAYAGLNFTVTATGRSGASRLAGSTTDYTYELLDDAANPASPPSKYYVRPSGVSGRQVAKDGTYSGSLALYGYGFDLTKFQLSFLSNENEDSWVNGGVTVGGDSPPNFTEFTQLFRGLKLTCLGELADAEIDPADTAAKPLVYWNGEFRPKTIGFATHEINPGSCPKAYKGTLALGVSTEIAHILLKKDKPTAEDPKAYELVAAELHGMLGFLPNGNLTTAAHPSGVDSQLGLPSPLHIKGKYANEKKGKDYQLATVGKLRFSNPQAPGITPPMSGFVTFAGTLKLPYFRALQVQAMTSASDSEDAPFHLAPGWEEGGKTFFSHALPGDPDNPPFDPHHRGFPSTTTFADYRFPTAATDNPYLLQATQDLFGIIPLGYPLKWDDAARRFVSMKEVQQSLFITEMPHRVEWMDAKVVNLSLGKRYEGMPEVKLDALRNFGIVGPSASFAIAMGPSAQAVLDDGFDAMDKLLADSLEAYADDIAARVVGGEGGSTALRAMFADFESTLAGMVTTVGPSHTYGDFLAQLQSRLTQLDPVLEAELESAASAVLIGETRTALERFILGIDTLIYGFYANDGVPEFTPTLPNALPPFPPEHPRSFHRGLLAKSDKRDKIELLAETLILNMVEPKVKKVVKPLLKNGGSDMSKELKRQFKDADSGFDRIVDALKRTRKHLVTLHADLANGQPAHTRFTALITDAKNGGEFEAISDRVAAAVESRIARTAEALGADNNSWMLQHPSFLTEWGGEKWFGEMKTRIRDELAGGSLLRRSRFLLHQHLYDPATQFTGSVQSTFDRLNEIMRGTIFKGTGALDEETRFKNPILGALEAHLGAAGLNGYAEFNGDSLRKLRLDGSLELKLKKDLKCKGWLEILCYSSEDNFVQSGCIEKGQKVVEITLGAKDVGFSWEVVKDKTDKSDPSGVTSFEKKTNKIKCDIGGKISLKQFSENAPYVPAGLGGSFKLTNGKIEIGGFELKSLSAVIAMGLDEAYFGAKAKGAFPKTPYELGIGLFIGRTCTLEPIRAVDSDIAGVLVAGNIYTGLLVYGEVWLPISEVVLGIPATCLFRVDAGVGAGVFVFAEEASGKPVSAAAGAKILAGISGEALCVVSIRGEVKLVGGYTGGKIVASGTGKISGSLGWCPVCVEFAAQLKLKYKDGDWSMDY